MGPIRPAAPAGLGVVCGWLSRGYGLRPFAALRTLPCAPGYVPAALPGLGATHVVIAPPGRPLLPLTYHLSPGRRAPAFPLSSFTLHLLCRLLPDRDVERRVRTHTRHGLASQVHGTHPGRFDAQEASAYAPEAPADRRSCFAGPWHHPCRDRTPRLATFTFYLLPFTSPRRVPGLRKSSKDRRK